MSDPKFKKPLGKWITEEEDVERIVNTFDPSTKKITTETITEKQKIKVMYEKTLLEGMFCPNFHHNFKIIDSHNYVIKCKNCPLHKHISPGNEYIDSEGKVRSRETDEQVA